MKNSKSSKLIEILALVVAIIGLSIGFAAYSNSLRLAELIVGPDEEDFIVTFSSSDFDHESDDVIRGVASGGAIAEDVKIVGEKGNSLANVKVSFSEPGGKVTYTFYAHNEGRHDAFLRTITFENVMGENFPRVCKAVNPKTTNSALVSRACEDISLTIDVGGTIKTMGSIDNITKHSLPVNSKEPVVITIEYASDGERADGSFNVQFGSITLTYLSVNEMGITRSSNK